MTTETSTALPRVLVVALSARALAESFHRAGHAVTAIDGFGDLDLHAVARPVIRCHPFSAPHAAQLARGVASDAVIYGSPFENDPQSVAVLAAAHQLWGNTPDVLRRVRDPVALTDILQRQGFLAPDVRVAAPRRGSRDASREWLIKPRRSGGGHDIAVWRPGSRVPETHVLQEHIPGAAESLAFAARGDDVEPLALTRQLVGDGRFGAHGFRYTGSILTPLRGPTFRHALKLARTVVREFGVQGLNGIDFIVRKGVPVPIEVNPRYTAPMELVERSDLGERTRVVAKAIVYAREVTIMGDTTSWLSDETVRDIPMPGTRIPRGAPICTVFADGPSAATCYRRLVTRAERIYALVARGG